MLNENENANSENNANIQNNQEERPESAQKSMDFSDAKSTSPVEGSFEETNEDNLYHAKSEDIIQNSVQEQTPSENYQGGVSYTDKANSANGYEWNSQSQPQTHAQKKAKKKGGKTSGLRIFTTAILTVFVLSFVALTAMVAISFVNGKTSATVSSQNNTTSGSNVKANAKKQDYAAVIADSESGAELTIPQIAAKCTPSAVGIKSAVETTVSYGFGFSQPTQGTVMGSGFIYSADGYIITNEHVIEDAKTITVVLNDKTEVEAELIGSDAISDIAVLKITPPDGKTLVPLEIGNSDDLVVGEEVVAIGCPAGIEYMGTVTNGIISAINRDIEITDSFGRVQKTMTLIQTNATINKGNSGGPLINSRGQVIGINNLKLNSEYYEGIGFSIPINGAVSVINQLMEHGEVVERTDSDFAYGSGMIGISGSAISEDEAKQYGIPQGVLVVQIDRDSAAANAGLRRGDIITKYNGTEVKTVNELNSLKEKNRAGESVTITVYRDSEDESDNSDGSTVDITFKLDTQK